MKPLRVALVHRDQWHRWNRIDGQFAYPVPEFVWEHVLVEKIFRLDLSTLSDFDLVWWDEGKHKGGPVWFNPPRGPARPVPLAYYCLYPTLNAGIRRDRQLRARDNADLVLLDHDKLELWQDVGIPARRCSYSVDETRYKPLEGGNAAKDVDVGFYCVWNYSPERRALNNWLAGYCERRGWTFGTNDGQGSEDYPRLLARCKVVVHINRTPDTRPPRIFDASACGAAVLASRMPVVNGESWEDGYTYVAFDVPSAMHHSEEYATREPYTDAECGQIAEALDLLIGGGHWQQIAGRAREYVLAEHTWARRAHYLRHALKDTLGL